MKKLKEALTGCRRVGALLATLALVWVGPVAKADLLFQNHSSGAIANWTMNGVQQTGSALLADPGSAAWTIVGAGDFTGDTLPDLLLQNSSSGQLVYWRMSGTSFESWGYLNPSFPGGSGWKAVAVADLNRDSKADIIFQNQGTGQLVYWLMNGISLAQWGYLPYPGSADWILVGAGDFNRNGNPDLLLQNRQTGALVYWQMNGTSLVSWSYLNPNNAGTIWRAVAVGDLNNDGYADVLFQNQSTNELAYWFLTGINQIGVGNIQPASPGNGWSAAIIWSPADHAKF